MYESDFQTVDLRDFYATPEYLEMERLSMIDLEERIKRRCPNAEWRRGNETELPYCRLDGEFCDTRCMWH